MTAQEIAPAVSLADQVDGMWDEHAEADPETLIWLDGQLADAARAIKDVRGRIDKALFDRLGPGTHTIEAASAEVVVKRGAPSYKAWDNEGLLRAVLDSRLADDEGTVVDESPLDKVRHVYNLGGSAARREALRARGLDPADYCTIERAPKVDIRR